MLVRFAFAFLLAAFGMGAASAQTPFRPVAVVNDSAITGYDLAQRAQIMVMLGFPNNDSDALRAQALDQLVGDRLKMQAGEALGIRPTDEGYAAGLGAFAEQAGMTAEAFVAEMGRTGITEQALRDMIDAELVWREVIRALFSNRLDVGEGEIDAELGLISQATSSAFRLQEIGLPISDGTRGEAETRALADRLSRELAAGGDFTAAARQYSRAPSAANGGEVGWVSRGQIPAELYALLSQLGAGGVSEPLPVQGGLSILKVLEVRTESGAGVDAADPAIREEVRSRIANQRAQRLAEGYLQELRRDALIEVR